MTGERQIRSPLPTGARARGPKRAAADNPSGIIGGATRRERPHSRGTRRALCRKQPFLHCAVSALRVTGATPSDRRWHGGKQPAATSRRGHAGSDARWALVVRVRRGQRAPREASAPLRSRSRRAAGWDRRVLAIVTALHATGTPWDTPRLTDARGLARRARTIEGTAARGVTARAPAHSTKSSADGHPLYFVIKVHISVDPFHQRESSSAIGMCAEGADSQLIVG